MKGIIIVNPFAYSNMMSQAERLKEEFNKMGVETEIVKDGWKLVSIKNCQISVAIKKVDFVLFLDKDKYLSEALTKSGYRLFNSHEAIRVCDDKGETYMALTGSGLKMPKTLFAPLCYREDCKMNDEDRKKIIEEIPLPIVIKESYGSLGMGVYKAETEEELAFFMDKLKMKPHLYQEYLPYKFGTDVRVIVIGKKVVASMERVNENDFRSNVARGGTGRLIELKEDFKRTAEKCAEILDLDYCGVDLLYGENGEPYVCEVNSNAFFEGIEKTTGINVAEKYAEYIYKTVKEK